MPDIAHRILLVDMRQSGSYRKSRRKGMANGIPSLVENFVHTVSSRSVPSKVAAPGVSRGVSFSVVEGEIFGLLGPNGGGKSTTFHILSTYFRPTGGIAQVFGHDVSAEPEKVRRELGVVFQSPGLDKKLTVWENLMHQGHLYGMSGQALRDRILFILTRVALSDRKDEFVESFSGGMKRRVGSSQGSSSPAQASFYAG